MKIRKIKIKGYKVFDDIEFDFTNSEGKALDTVVIAGVNGSGKTTLLSLISSFFRVENSENSDVNLNHVDKYFLSFVEEVQIELEINNILINEIRKEKDKRPQTTFILEYATKILQSYQIHNEINILNLFYRTSFNSNNTLRIEKNDFFYLFYFISNSWNNNHVSQSQIFYLPADNYIHEVNNNNGQIEGLKNIYKNIINDKKGISYIINFKEHKKFVEKFIVETALKEVMNNQNSTPKQTIQKMVTEINQIVEAVDIKTKLIDITSEEPIFESFNGERISINDLSNGEKQIFYRTVFLQNMNINDSIILVDEPETSLHPTWQQAIVKLYQNIGKNNQVILASHSPHAISSVKPESLFVLYPDTETSKIEVMNMGKEHLHTKGLEPNRVLKEIMGTPLRDYETQQKIEKVTENLTIENFENPEIQELIEELSRDLGRQDSFIMKVNHQIMMLKRKKVPAN